MEVIYNSPSYCVLEFKANSGDGASSAIPFQGGFEIMDKTACREMFINGVLAQFFRQRVYEILNSDPTAEAVDAFIGNFDFFMHQPITLH